MPTFLLRIKADLEGIKEMTPIVGTEWCFDVKNPTGTDVRNDITVSSQDSQPIEGSRGEAHFLLKWPGEKKQAYLNILHPEIPISYTNEDSGTWKTILSMECRGLEPSRWKPRADFTVTSLGGKVFDSVDLSENDWSDYDEENSLAVTILDLEYKIEREK